MGWNQPRRVIIPWMETLSRMLGSVALPTFRGRSLWVVSDYSFDNPDSDFDVVGLLLADPEASGAWNQLRQAVRAECLVDSRRMSWKRLNSDSRRQAAFLPFLRAADHIHGLALTLAFHRDPAFQLPVDRLDRFRVAFRLSANWKAHNLQNMFRIASCVAMLVAGLSSPEQAIHWVSDQDPAFSNETMENDTVGVFAKLLTVFSPHKLGEVRYGSTGSGAEPLFQEDLASVPDLMCGATCEIITALKREYHDLPRIYAKLPELTTRPREFLNWYGSEGWPLKRYICSFECRDGRPPSVGILPPELLVRA